MKPGEQFSPKGLFTGVWVPTWLAKVRRLPAAAKLVYGRAANLDTGSGVVEFRIGWMAGEVGLDEKTVRASIGALEQRKFWRVERPEGVDRLTHQPHRYVFLWHEAIGAASLRRTRMVDGPGETPTPEWEEHPPRTGRNAHSSTKRGEEGLGEHPPTPRKRGATEEHHRLATLLADLVEGNGSLRPGTGDRAADVIRLMVERDGRTLEQVEAAIRWSQRDEFWRSVVLSPRKLRQHFDAMRLRAAEQRANAAGTREEEARRERRAGLRAWVEQSERERGAA
jgi:hypothetical protein